MSKVLVESKVAELQAAVAALQAEVAELKATKTNKKEKEPKQKKETNIKTFNKASKQQITELTGFEEKSDEFKEFVKKVKVYANSLKPEDYSSKTFVEIVSETKALDAPAESTLVGGGGELVGGGAKPLPRVIPDLVDYQDDLKKTEEVGVYLLDDELVTGKPRNEDEEDLEEVTFKGLKALMDKATGRVYDSVSEEFIGYALMKKKKFAGLI